jgi:hypothetical protein
MATASAATRVIKATGVKSPTSKTLPPPHFQALCGGLFHATAHPNSRQRGAGADLELQALPATACVRAVFAIAGKHL